MLAALTDGDIRRWILQKGDLNAAVKNAANYSPKYLVGAGRQQALQYMREQCIDALPIVDDAGMIHSIVLWNENEIVLRGTVSMFLLSSWQGAGNQTLSLYQDIAKAVDTRGRYPDHGADHPFFSAYRMPEFLYDRKS